jgi:hypothetical protein
MEILYNAGREFRFVVGGRLRGARVINWNSEVQLVLDHERRCRSFGA